MEKLKALLTSSFARFLLVGLFNTAVGLTTSFVCFNLLHLNYWASTFIGNSVGAIVSYALNRTFTFRSQASVQSSWWKFAMVILSCYGIAYGGSWLTVNAIASLLPALPKNWLDNAAILTGNGIYTIGNYLGHKYFTFRTGAAKKHRNA